MITTETTDYTFDAAGRVVRTVVTRTEEPAAPLRIKPPHIDVPDLASVVRRQTIRALAAISARI
jgi:hypothetical protein